MADAEHVTVLFTDMVGSTELSSSVAADEADELRRAHFSVLRQALATADGTEVKNLGDGLMAVFRSASAAIGCAVAMQQAVDAQNRTGAGRHVGLRVGLSSGDATREDDDYFGDPIIEAARLCARAQGGQTLISDLTRAGAGRRSPFTFHPLGALELKGLPEPVETLEVAWEPLGDDAGLAPGRVPLPGQLAQLPQFGVVAREPELETLGDAVKRVSSGAGREVALVAGEPGQGKSTLVAEAARRAHAGGATVLLGRCDEEVRVPYGAFIDALSPLVAHVEEELLHRYVATFGAELDRLVPTLRQRLGDLPPSQSGDADTERYLLFGAVVGLLDQVSAAAPLVLVLEDVHWADVPTLHLLRHLVARTTSSTTLIVATYRDAEISATDPLGDTLASLRRERDVSTLALKGLDDVGVVSFVEAAAGHDLAEDAITFAHAIYRETDGNPFFVGEVLRHLSESGAIVQDATGHWGTAGDPGTIALPDSVRQVIGRRVARLGEPAMAMLSTAAVIGRDFDLELLTRATDVDEDEILDVLDAAQSAALVTETGTAPGWFSFAHALIQHTLYDDLGPTRRARLHRQVGEALERLPEASRRRRVAELARHFRLATRPGEVDKAFVYAREAGDAALDALAPNDACEYFAQALDLIEHGVEVDATTRLDLEIALGTAQRQAGVPAFRETLLTAARHAQEQGDSERLVAAALANNRGFFSAIGIVDRERVTVVESALQALPPGDSTVRARLLARLCSEETFGPLDRRLELATEAQEVARRVGDPATLANVVLDCAGPCRIPSQLARVVAAELEARDLAGDAIDPVSLYWLHEHLHVDLARAGRFVEAAACLDVTDTLAQRLQQPVLIWNHLTMRGGWAMLHGDIAALRAFADAAHAEGLSSGQPDAEWFHVTQHAGALAMEGRMGDMAALVAELAAQSPGVAGYWATAARAYYQGGDRDRARELVEDAASSGFDLPMDIAWLDGIVVYSSVAIDLGLPGPCEQLRSHLVPYHDQVVYEALTANGPAAMYLGGFNSVLGAFEEAERFFAESAELSTRGEMRHAAVTTDLWWGQMLLSRGAVGDGERGRSLLERARATARESGYRLLEQQAAEALALL